MPLPGKKHATTPTKRSHSGRKSKENRQTGSSKTKKHASAKSKTRSSSGKSHSALIAPGVATDGWVRPKTSRKSSTESAVTSSPAKSPATLALPAPEPQPTRPRQKALPPPVARTIAQNRKSIMSFASDSTRLGEIPQHKWARPPVLNGQEVKFPVVAYYPLDPPQQPKKQRIGIMRLFKKKE